METRRETKEEAPSSMQYAELATKQEKYVCTSRRDVGIISLVLVITEVRDEVAQQLMNQMRSHQTFSE